MNTEVCLGQYLHKTDLTLLKLSSFQRSINDEQYSIYQSPGVDGLVISNLRIKSLGVCNIMWNFMCLSLSCYALQQNVTTNFSMILLFHFEPQFS